MTGDLFEEWVRGLDTSFRAQNRKIVLLIDNCPAHPEINNLTNINLVFLPPNTTSVLQPMDQGVIRSLKAHYRKMVVRLCIKALEGAKSLPKISILQAMKHLVSSWNAVSKETIVNCFKKSNISISNQQAAVNDYDDPFKSLQEDIDRLNELDNEVNLSAEAFSNVDSDVVTSATIESDEDIIAQLIEVDEGCESEEDDQDGESVWHTRPSASEIGNALEVEVLQDLSLFSTHGEQIHSLVLKIESTLILEKCENLKQSCMTDFFRKK